MYSWLCRVFDPSVSLRQVAPRHLPLVRGEKFLLLFPGGVSRIAFPIRDEGGHQKPLPLAVVVYWFELMEKKRTYD